MDVSQSNSLADRTGIMSKEAYANSDKSLSAQRVRITAKLLSIELNYSLEQNTSMYQN